MKSIFEMGLPKVCNVREVHVQGFSSAQSAQEWFIFRKSIFITGSKPQTSEKLRETNGNHFQI